jgi:DNA-binding XRE family transcriptional regulator
MSISEMIRERRVALGLTKTALAATMDVTTPAVHFWETGKTVPCKKHRIAMARLFEIPVEALTEAAVS